MRSTLGWIRAGLVVGSLVWLYPTVATAADVEVTPAASGVTASTNDGNVPGNTVDGSLATRWSANGDGQWIRFDLGTTRTVTSVSVAVYQGNTRAARFDLQTSTDGTTWTNVLTGAQSGGTTTQEEAFDIPDTSARYVRYLGHGNTVNAWNSLNEVSVFALAATATPTPTPTATPVPRATATPTPTATTAPSSTKVKAIPLYTTASTNDGNGPENTADSNLATRWAANGDGQWLRFDLDSTQTVAFVKVAHYSGNTRRGRFDLQVSSDGTTWSNVLTGAEGSGTTTALETFDFTDTSARYVRYLGHGNSTNAWNSLNEMEVHVTPNTATHISLGGDGKLAYTAYANGDKIPDFSYAGYGGGGVALPNVPVKATVNPASGDRTAAIQAAIDNVSAMAPDASGFRGAVLLNAGTYEVAGSVTISTSGVVLRGAGDAPTGGTLFNCTGTVARSVIQVAGVADRTELAGTRVTITDSYVPVGTRTIHVSSAAGFSVGDHVIVERPKSQEWIDAVGMDACSTVTTSYDTSDVDGDTCISESAWAVGTEKYERQITAISGNTITIDAPTVQSIDVQFGAGSVYKYTFPGRIQKVGVESIRAHSTYVSDTDNDHAARMVSLSNVENAWVRNVTARYFVKGAVVVNPGSKWVTVQDSESLDHKSALTGGFRYPFYMEDCERVLIMRCYATDGRHDFVTGSATWGPNVFLDSRADRSHSDCGPHHRWSTGELYDNISHDSSSGNNFLGVDNRGNLGSGQGWSGAQQVFWNCVADKMQVDNPPHGRNWAIGCRTQKKNGNGDYQGFGKPVGPWSLYLQQLKDRLGSAAVTNIGY